MTIPEARKICQDFYDLTNPAEDDEFVFTEAMRLAFIWSISKNSNIWPEKGKNYDNTTHI